MSNKVHNTRKKALLDDKALNDLRDIMDDEFIEVLQLYLEESVSLMSDIHVGFSEGPDKLLHAVQALRSSSHNVGAVCLGEMVAKMEKHLLKEELESAKEMLDELQDVFTETHGLIKNHAQSEMQKAAS